MTAESPRPHALEAVAGISFLLLVASLPTTIAPMGITSVLCAVLTLACFMRTPRPKWTATPVNAPAFAWLAAVLIVSAFSLEPVKSFARFNKGLLPALVGLAAFHAADRRTGHRALAVFFSTAVLAAVIGTVIWWQHGHSYLWRAGGLTNHYMTYGGQLQMVFPVALAVLLLTRSARWRWLSGLATLVSGVALASTYTRSSWLGAFAAAVLIVAAVWPRGVLVPAVLATLLWKFAPGDWGARLHSMFDAQSGYNGERLLMWQAGAHMFRDHPLTGVGLQDLHSLYEQHYHLPQATEMVRHLHNTYVQIAASMGLVGLVAFVWLFGSLFTAAAPALMPIRGFAARLRSGGEGAALRLGVTAALVGFLVAGCFEWNFGDEELLYPLFVLVGIAWASRGWQLDDQPGAEGAGAR